MSRPARFNGKVYRPVKFGERNQVGTVDWELKRRSVRKRLRDEDEAFERRNRDFLEEQQGWFWSVWNVFVRFFASRTRF